MLIMKRILKYIVMPCLLLAGVTSCEDEDKNRMTPFSELTKGAYFRTVDNGGVINRTDIAGSTYSVTGELVFETGTASADVSNVQMWVQFVDRTTDGDPDTPDDDSVAAVLFETADISSFSTNANGFPEYSFSVGISDALAALGLDVASVDGGDQFLFKIAITMSDGTVYDTNNTGDSVKGELFFSSPMVYTGSVVCILPSPPVGDWVIDMQDSYGDGWNGAAVRVTLDGVPTDYGMADGAATSHTITVPPGASTLTWEYVSGAWDSEVTFQIYAPSGNLVADVGPSPVAGEITLNLCNE